MEKSLKQILATGKKKPTDSQVRKLCEKAYSYVITKKELTQADIDAFQDFILKDFVSTRNFCYICDKIAISGHVFTNKDLVRLILGNQPLRHKILGWYNTEEFTKYRSSKEFTNIKKDLEKKRLSTKFRNSLFSK